MGNHIATIAFCADVYMEVPLHVAASSLLRNLHPNWTAKIYLLTDGIGKSAIGRLRETLNLVERPYELVEITLPNTGVFRKLRPFHGSHAAYYRLLLPSFAAEKRFLYLDTDTVTKVDVSPLFQLDMDGYPLGFVVEGSVKYDLQHEFLISQGAKEDDPVLNSGVILFDVEQWKAQHCFSRLMDFCNAHPASLLAADQTAFNVLFVKHCYHLALEFNVKLYAHGGKPVPDNGIYHFVGSPKPWDLFGEFFHSYAYIWNEASGRIALRLTRRSAYTDFRNWRRLPRIIGGYRRILRARIARLMHRSMVDSV